LRERLFTRTEDLPKGVERVALKEIHLNKSPIVLPPTMLDEQTADRLQIDRSLMEQHWQQLCSLSIREQETLQEKLYELYSEIGFIEKTDPEQMLYNGFFDDYDKKLMAQVRRANPKEFATKQFAFHDSRLDELLFRYRARNFVDSLSAAEAQNWKEFCRRRRTDASAGASTLITDLRHRVAELLALETLTDSQKSVLDDLLVYADSL